MQQANLPFETSEDAAEVARTMLQPFPVNEYPNLGAMIDHAMKPGYNFGDEFDVPTPA